MLRPAAAGASSGETVRSDSTGAYSLDEIVVSATRVERAVKDLSATVSVITRQDIEAENTNSCTDILGSLPGVFVNKTGDFGRADVDIRGLGDRGRSVMVLTDGRPVKMGLMGCTITHTLPLNNVERIEMVRGPASVLYGSDAMGGVINIITRRAESGFEGDLTSSYGSYNTRHLRLRHGGAPGRVNYYLTGDWRTSDGHVPNSAYEGWDGTVRLGYQLTERIEAALSAKHFDGRKEEPQLDPRDVNYTAEHADAWNEYRRGAVELSLNSRLGRWEGHLMGYRNFGDHLFSDGWDSEDVTHGGILHVTGPVAPGNNLTLGFDARQQGGEVFTEAFAGRWDKTEAAVFAHDEQVLLDRFILTLGARYHHDEIAGGEFCPQAGLVFHMDEKTILRGLVNKGFRAPQINELFIFPPHNEDLEAEVVWNYEIGANRILWPGIAADVAVYRMDGSNLIEMAANESPPPMFLFQNIGEFRFQGLEAGLEIRPAEGFQARLGYTYLDPGKRTAGRPGNKVDIAARWTWNRILLSAAGQYVTRYYAADQSRQRVPDSFVMDLKVNYQVISGLRAFLAVDNLLDDTYAVYANLPGSAAGLYTMPRRRATAGLLFEM
jgi:iron complex outermembrane receptor protein